MSRNDNALITVTGGCHCGAVRLEAKTVREPEMLDCNCSICASSGYLHLFIPHEHFKLLSGADQLTSYRFGSRTAEHFFYKVCGVKSFYQPRSHPGEWSVHFKCLDDVSALAPRITAFDGRNWDKAAAEKGLGQS